MLQGAATRLVTHTVLFPGLGARGYQRRRYAAGDNSNRNNDDNNDNNDNNNDDDNDNSRPRIATGSIGTATETATTQGRDARGPKIRSLGSVLIDSMQDPTVCWNWHYARVADGFNRPKGAIILKPRAERKRSPG